MVPVAPRPSSRCPALPPKTQNATVVLVARARSARRERTAQQTAGNPSRGGSAMLQLSDIQSSPEQLQDYYAQLRAQHVTPAWIGAGISVEPQSQAVPYVWHWRDLRSQAMRAAGVVGTAQAGGRGGGPADPPHPRVP